jgi:hypothetical protein
LDDECRSRVVLQQVGELGLLGLHLRAHALELPAEPRLLGPLHLLRVPGRRRDALRLPLLRDEHALLEIEPLRLHPPHARLHLDHVLQKGLNVVVRGGNRMVGGNRHAAAPFETSVPPKSCFALQPPVAQFIVHTRSVFFGRDLMAEEEEVIRTGRGLRRLSNALASDELRSKRESGDSLADELSSVSSFRVISALAEADSGIDMDDLTFVRRLGVGGFSTVDLCLSTRIENYTSTPPGASLDALKARLYAVKRMRTHRSARATPRAHVVDGPVKAHPTGSQMSAFEGVSFLSEAALLRSLRHPNLVTCYGAIGRHGHKLSDGLGGAAAEYALLLEYVPGGSLAQRIKRCDYDATLAIGWLLGIARGMAYLHEIDGVAVVHRDLKPDNVLLDANSMPKICDFGLATCVVGDGAARAAADVDADGLEPCAASANLTARTGTDLYMVRALHLLPV